MPVRLDAKITIRMMGLHGILGRDYGVEEPYWGANMKLVGCLFGLPGNRLLILLTSAITK